VPGIGQGGQDAGSAAHDVVMRGHPPHQDVSFQRLQQGDGFCVPGIGFIFREVMGHVAGDEDQGLFPGQDLGQGFSKELGSFLCGKAHENGDDPGAGQDFLNERDLDLDGVFLPVGGRA